ncbi:MAG: hypothetical protein KAV87_52020 [Desulfobacteraceae bacterium]|nr:hypothetical protein [Desulfobacteraceae bacterium]
MITINREVKLTICIHSEEYVKVLREIIEAGQNALTDPSYIEPSITDKVAKVFLDNLK